jgi:hypothetical protein
MRQQKLAYPCVLRERGLCGELNPPQLCGEFNPPQLCGEFNPPQLCGEFNPPQLCGEFNPPQRAAAHRQTGSRRGKRRNLAREFRGKTLDQEEGE